MTWPCWRHGLVLGVTALVTASAHAQTSPTIDHEAESCWLANEFPQLAAGIQPGAEVETAKVYFRSDKFADFYFVEMKMVAVADFLAVLPKPGPETERVIYYVEAVDSSFSNARTAEFDPAVSDPCKRRPAAVIGSNPEIVVGATKAGVAAIPPGFQATGIVGFITAAGVTSGVGGGVGLGTTAVVAGVGAAAAGGIVVASGGEPPASTTIPAALPPTTTSSGAVGSSTTTSSTSTMPSTTSVAPTTTTTSASTTSAPSTTTTTSAVTTTVPSTTTTSVAAPPVTACFTMRKLNSCVWRFDASCSAGPIVQFDWAIDPAGNMPAPRPPVSHSGQVVIVDWNPPTYGGCSGAPFITAQLTVVGSLGQTDSRSQGVNIDLKPFRERVGFETSFTSTLELDGHGFVVIHQIRTDSTSGSTPFRHSFRGVSGENTIEAYVHPSGSNGLWKFDFSSTRGFVPGSLRAASGALALLDMRTIVFRLSGDSGERIRFSFDLSQD
jgi:hypothetical protein